MVVELVNEGIELWLLLKKVGTGRPGRASLDFSTDKSGFDPHLTALSKSSRVCTISKKLPCGQILCCQIGLHNDGFNGERILVFV